MSAIIMTVESVKTRGSTGEALLTLSVPLEQAALISKFMSLIGKQVGVAFADPQTGALVEPEKLPEPDPEPEPQPSGWDQFSGLTKSAIMLCKEPRFQQFVAEMIYDVTRCEPGHKAHEQECANFIKRECGVTTRKDLERIEEARVRFGALMADYREWQNRDGRRTH